MKTFKDYIKEDGSGAAPTTSTAGVAGAGDNSKYPEKVVPVSKEAQKRIRAWNHIFRRGY